MIYAKRILNILILVTAVMSLSYTVRNLLDRSNISLPELKLPHQSSAKARKKINYLFLLEKNPFGIKTTAPDNRKDTGPPEELILVGTIYDKNNKGYAVLMDKKGNQRIYRTGQKIDGLGVLRTVSFSEAVFEGKTTNKLKVAELQEIRQTKNRRLPRVGHLPNRYKDNFIRSLGANQYVVDRMKVEEAISKPEQLMTDARLQPAFHNGRQYGFVLREVKKDGIYYKLGLRNGDVLLKINEFDITNPEVALQAFNELKGADEIVLHIVRRGKNKTLRYMIR